MDNKLKTPHILRTVSIDPGTIKVGVSIFDDGVPVESSFFKASGDPYDRCLRLAQDVSRYVRLSDPDVVICEYPQLFSGSDAGVGAKESGRILILFHFCGMLHYALRKKCLIRFVLPIQWKGNLKKHHTQDRIFEKYGIIDNEDVIDAVGINDWFITEGSQMQWSEPFLKKRL